MLLRGVYGVSRRCCVQTDVTSKHVHGQLTCADIAGSLMYARPPEGPAAVAWNC